MSDIAISMITGSLSRRAGGLFHSVRNLSQALDRMGVKVSVIGLRDPDTSADLDQWSPIKPIVLNTVGSERLGYALDLRATLRAQKPDVVHQHGIWQAFSRETALWALKGPTMVSPRGMLDSWALTNSRWNKLVAWHGWEACNLKRARRIHALARSEAESISRILPNAHISIVPNGVTLNSSSCTRRLNRGTRELLYLGRLHPKKGVLDLLAQWSYLPTAIRSSWRVTIAGPDEGGYRNELEKYVKRHKMTNEIAFVGPLVGQAKENAFRRAHAFVLPSYSEGLPMAVLEAWSYELPVIMTRACNLDVGFYEGAAAEILTGQDPSALQNALTRYDLDELGRKGRRLVEARFTWDLVAAQHLKEYRDMLADQHSR